MLCSASRNDVPPIPQRNVSIAAERGAVRPSIMEAYELFSNTYMTHCKLVDSSTVICWTNPFVILGVSDVLCHFYSISDGKSHKQTM